jgi:hypothetical protein
MKHAMVAILAGGAAMNQTSLFGALAFAALLLACPGKAHDYGWGFEMGDMRNPINGKFCCGQNDCGIVMPAPKAIKGGWAIHGEVIVGESGHGRRVRVDEVVPYDEVLPSPDGHFWRCHSIAQHYSGAYADITTIGSAISYEDLERRCFFAPPQTL